MAALQGCISVSVSLQGSLTKPQVNAALPSVHASTLSKPGALSSSRHSSVFALTPIRTQGLKRSCAAFSRAGPVAPVAAVKWVLEPVGDGDSSHLEEAVEKPGPVTLEGEAFLVGRVPDRSDIVIPVPTVSGSHARIEKKGDDLYVTDLNSTNGTFLDEQRLSPGAAVLIPNGSVLTFGDQHLAMFKAVQVIEAVDV